MKEKRKSSFAGYFVRQRRILYHVLSFYFFLAVEVALVVAAFVALLVFVVDLAVGLVTFAVRFDLPVSLSLCSFTISRQALSLIHI